jgi:hypothetical protein
MHPAQGMWPAPLLQACPPYDTTASACNALLLQRMIAHLPQQCTHCHPGCPHRDTAARRTPTHTLAHPHTGGCTGRQDDGGRQSSSSSRPRGVECTRSHAPAPSRPPGRPAAWRGSLPAGDAAAAEAQPPPPRHHAAGPATLTPPAPVPRPPAPAAAPRSPAPAPLSARAQRSGHQVGHVPGWYSLVGCRQATLPGWRTTWRADSPPGGCRQGVEMMGACTKGRGAARAGSSEPRMPYGAAAATGQHVCMAH